MTNEHTEPIGPATETHMPEITLRGNSYQRGVQYGKAMKRHLEGFYYWFVRAEPRDVLTGEYRTVLIDMEEMCSQHFPQMLEQIKGWADGSKLPYDMCRIMSFHNGIRSILSPGCSNIIVTNGPDGPWLAKNNDLNEKERSWQIRIIAHCDDGFSHIKPTYIGLPSGQGLNSAGLAIGGSSLPAKMPDVVKGMPNLTYYLILTQSSVNDCIEQVKALGFAGKGSHLALLDANADAAALELGSGEVIVRRPDDSGLLVVTNHSASGQTPHRSNAPEQYMENSRCRYDRLVEIFRNIDPDDRTIETAKRALADHAGRWGVCEHVEGGFHTIYSYVARPASDAREMMFCWGYPCRHPFVRRALQN